MVALALLVVLAKFTGYFQYKYMKVQSALENTMAKKSSTKSIKVSGNKVFERIFCPVSYRFLYRNLVEDGGMKIITDPDDDVFINENKYLIK